MDEMKVTQQKLHADVIAKLNEWREAFPTRNEFGEMGKIVDDHETRLRSSEKFVWKATGIAVAVGTAASIVVQLLVK